MVTIPAAVSFLRNRSAYIGELEPGSAEGNLARLRLASLLMDQGRPEAALPHLTRAVMSGGGQGIDRAWYQLGQLYERPWYHRDTRKAAAAYKRVLQYSHSPYLHAAQERIRLIERFGTGSARP
jgi:predicted negative regulator of RcsB-dependent stress response